MLKIKNDFYAKYLDTDGRFWEVKKGIYRIQVEKRKNLLGFKNYDEVELKDKMFIDVSKNKISSAYRVRTYCNYKEGKYDLSNIADNTVILFPDLETKRKIGFHIYNDNSVDVSYDKFVIEVTDVWEERTPIKGFRFEEEPIVYLKKNGVWLVEHQKEEIVQNQEKLEKQLSENKIDKEEYDKKTKENISQWEKTLSVYNDVESFTEKHPLITKEEVNELKELQQQKSFAGNSVGKRDLENTKKINERQTKILSKIAQREQSAIADIKQYLEDFVHESTDTSTTHCKEWKKAKGGIGKIGQYNLDYIEYQECTNGTMYKAKGGVFYFFHTQYNVYANALSQDHDKEYFYVYEPNSQKWERFFPDFREFKRAPMPDELRNFLFTVVDYIIPIESGYILITGKNFEGEERSRLVAGTSLVIEAGLTFTVVGKGFYKAGKGVLKAGKNATSAIVKSKKVLKGSAKELEVATEVVVKNAGEIENLINKALIQELKEKGVKFTEENLMWLFKNKDGKIIFLEKGKNSGGFQHILKHKEEFLDKGIFEEDLAEFIMKSLKNGKIVGKEGSRFVYEYIYKGIKQTTAITVSSNGFVVGANPVSKFKKL